ncbi:hypothetical protein COCNU_16G001780 [Cocos nucifera]|uniref:Uncharacterized protein n=1 Tax=Cocos nucifera TaxID=13894 RepID=A0A8K0IYA2_COCNU|nr:hypothetical protein COCNU_16G001780 [Cocos nucifera]
MAHVSDIKLIRTDTTLDLSQKAEKGMKLPCLHSSHFIAVPPSDTSLGIRCGTKKLEPLHKIPKCRHFALVLVLALDLDLSLSSNGQFLSSDEPGGGHNNGGGGTKVRTSEVLRRPKLFSQIVAIQSNPRSNWAISMEHSHGRTRWRNKSLSLLATLSRSLVCQKSGEGTPVDCEMAKKIWDSRLCFWVRNQMLEASRQGFRSLSLYH